MAGPTHILPGVGDIATLITAGHGAGTILGDIIDGDGLAITAGVTHTMDGDGPVITAGEATMADTGTVHIIPEDIITGVTPICLEEEGIIHEFPEPICHTGQVLIQVGSGTTVDVPTPLFQETAHWPTGAPKAIAVPLP